MPSEDSLSEDEIGEEVEHAKKLSRSNPIYQFYTVIEGKENKLNSLKCNKEITLVTTSLVKHLKRVHSKVFEKYEKEVLILKEGQKKRLSEKKLSVKRICPTVSTTGTVAKQRKITNFTGYSKVMQLAVSLAANRGVSFNLFDAPEMRLIMDNAKIGFKDDSSRVIDSANVKTAVQETAKVKREVIKKLLKGRIVDLTADFATCERRSFLGVNAQFYDRHLRTTRPLNLTCREVKERHYAKNIKGWILEVLQSYSINPQQVLVMSVDSAANITKAVKDVIDELNMNFTSTEPLEQCETESSQTDNILDESESNSIDVVPDELQDVAFKVNCVVHQLQLAVNAFMWKEPEVKKLIDKAVYLTNKLRTPIVKLKLDSEHQKQAKAHQETRWNSVALMLERIIDLKEFCQNNEESFRELEVDEKTWKNFEKLLEVLNHASILTKQLQSENLLIPDFIYYWKSMTLKLTVNTSDFAKKLLSRVEAREQNIFNNSVIQAGWFLDKTVGLLITDHQIKDKAKTVIKMVQKKQNALLDIKDEELTQETLPDLEEDCDEEGVGGVENVNPLDVYLRTLGKASGKSFQICQKNINKSLSHQAALDMELQDYESMPIPSEKVNSLTWWQENGKRFPILSEIALDIISAPVTEVSVERLFSHLKLILTKNRSCLKGNLLEDILFLRMNQTFENML